MNVVTSFISGKIWTGILPCKTSNTIIFFSYSYPITQNLFFGFIQVPSFWTQQNLVLLVHVSWSLSNVLRKSTGFSAQVTVESASYTLWVDYPDVRPD